MLNQEIEVAAAIGGSPFLIKQFIHTLNFLKIPSHFEIANLFNIIKIDEDFTVFAAHFGSITWTSKDEAAWQAIRGSALPLGLSWIFYYIRKQQDDFFQESGAHSDKTFDKRMLTLFDIKHSIKFHEPKLNYLDPLYCL